MVTNEEVEDDDEKGRDQSHHNRNLFYWICDLPESVLSKFQMASIGENVSNTNKRNSPSREENDVSLEHLKGDDGITTNVQSLILVGNSFVARHVLVFITFTILILL